MMKLQIPIFTTGFSASRCIAASCWISLCFSTELGMTNVPM